jgi:hypothetical protein
MSVLLLTALRTLRSGWSHAGLLFMLAGTSQKLWKGGAAEEHRPLSVGISVRWLPMQGHCHYICYQTLVSPLGRRFMQQVHEKRLPAST